MNDEALRRAKAMVDGGIATDIETALLISKPKPTRVIVEVVENGTVRKLLDEPGGGEGRTANS